MSAARRKSTSPLKVEKIEIRVTKEQKEEINSMASSLGLNASAYMLLCYNIATNTIFNLSNYVDNDK